MQQLKMATYFEEILGDMLLKVENMKNNCQHIVWNGIWCNERSRFKTQVRTFQSGNKRYALKIMKKMKDFLPSNPMKKGVAMPSPNQLKRKVLLKHKRLKADVEKTEMELFLKVRTSKSNLTQTIMLTTMVRVLSKLMTQPKTRMLQLLRRSRTSQLVWKSLNWFHRQ